MRIRQLAPAAIVILMAGALLLAPGCGFRPVYAGPAYDSLRNVNVQVRGEDRFAYLVETAMIERLGAGDTRAGRLRVAMRIRQRNLGVSADGEASRIALDIRARYTLSLPRESNLRGTVTERVAFETPREPYALISARANAERQAAETIADSLLRTVAADLRRRQLEGERPRVDPDRPDIDADDLLDDFDDVRDLDDLLGEEQW